MCELFQATRSARCKGGRPSTRLVKTASVCMRTLREPATGQMPKITRPNALHGRALHELTENGVDAVAPAGKLAAQAWPGVVLALAKGRQQLHTALRQVCMQARSPEIAITDEQPACACAQIFRRVQRLPIARRHLDLTQHARPTDASVQPEAVEG